MTLEYDMTMDDYRDGLRFIGFESSVGRRRYLRVRLLFAGLAPSIWAAFFVLGGRALVPTVTLALLWAATLWLVASSSFVRSWALDMRSSSVFEHSRIALGRWTVTSSSEGLRAAGPSGELHLAWDSVTAVEASDHGVFLFQGGNAFIVPAKAFRSSEDLAAFRADASRRASDARGGGTV